MNFCCHTPDSRMQHFRLFDASAVSMQGAPPVCFLKLLVEPYVAAMTCSRCGHNPSGDRRAPVLGSS